MIRGVYLSAGSSVALGTISALMGIPGPATSPGVLPTGMQIPVLVTLLIIVIPTTIGSWALLWIGLRGAD